MSNELKLLNIATFEGTITLESGLRIGSGDVEMHIGGVDSPVIRHPHTMEPYIPGSSIKGKVRSLLEMKYGLVVHTDGEPVSYNKIKEQMTKLSDSTKKAVLNILKLFGTSGADICEEQLGPTRAIFTDCRLSEDWKQEAIDKSWPFTEVKAENWINRINGTAGSPRFMERVPAGAKFDFLVKLKILNESEETELRKLLLEGLKLLELDGLGGSVSRGYGRISIKFDDEDLHKEFNDVNLFDN